MAGQIDLFYLENSAGNTGVGTAGFMDVLAEIEKTGIKFNFKGATGTASGGVVAAIIGNRVGHGGDTAAIAADIRKHSTALAAWAQDNVLRDMYGKDTVAAWIRDGGLKMAKHLTAQTDTLGLDKKALTMGLYNPLSWFAGMAKDFGKGMENVVKYGLPADYDATKIPAGFTAQMALLDKKLDPTGRMLVLNGADLGPNNIKALMTNISLSPTLPITAQGQSVYAGDPSTTYGAHNKSKGTPVGENLSLAVLPKSQDVYILGQQHLFRPDGYDPELFGPEAGKKQTAEFAQVKARGNAQIFSSTVAEMAYQGADFSKPAVKTMYETGRAKGIAAVEKLVAEGKITVDPAALQRVKANQQPVDDFMAGVETEKARAAPPKIEMKRGSFLFFGA